MAEKITLTISPAVAAYVRPGTTPETRLSGCSAAGDMEVADRLMLLFCLSKDAEPSVRATALANLLELPEEIIREYLDCVHHNIRILTALPALCKNYPAVSPPPAANEENRDTPTEPDDQKSDQGPEQDEALVDETNEEFLSKYKMAQLMGIGEKIKMALTGDKEWRSILVKDANKLVSGSVIKNPRITDGEILTLVKSGAPNDEIMRLICANKEWTKVYTIRKALIENNRTPVQNAMRYLGTMGEKDLAQLAKSKNIGTVVSTMAKRLLLNKKR